MNDTMTAKKLLEDAIELCTQACETVAQAQVLLFTDEKRPPTNEVTTISNPILPQHSDMVDGTGEMLDFLLKHVSEKVNFKGYKNIRSVKKNFDDNGYVSDSQYKAIKNSYDQEKIKVARRGSIHA